MKRLFAAIALACLAAAPGHALALNADAGLYDPAPPPGSAFVRFIGAWKTGGSNEARINGKPLEYVRFQDISDYFVAPQGKADIAFGDARATAGLEEGGYYSVILTGRNTATIVRDETGGNMAKAHILFYNLTPDKRLSLRTSDGGVEVVPPVEPGKTGARGINPVRVSLAVFDGDKVLRDLGDISFDRARSYAIVAYPGSEVRWEASTTNTSR